MDSRDSHGEVQEASNWTILTCW